MTQTTRRRVLVTVPVLAGLALAGCSSSGSAHSGSSPSSSSSGSGAGPVAGQGASNQVSVTGAFGKEPTVSIPTARAGDQLVTKTLISGTGTAIGGSTSVVSNLVLYKWSGTTNAKLGSSYASSPQLLSTGNLLPGLAKALTGQKVGSRVLAVVPPAQGYGPSGNPSGGVSGSDVLVFVVDVIGALPTNSSVSGKQTQAGAGLPTVSDTTTAQPTITMPKKNPPGMTSKTLIQGTGPAVQSGQYIVVQYTGAIWGTGKVFDSSYLHQQLFGTQIGIPNNGIITGWDIGLVGQKVGSRVLLVIPPNDGYGPKGNSQAGIKGTDTIVFIVDILGAY